MMPLRRHRLAIIVAVVGGAAVLLLLSSLGRYVIQETAPDAESGQSEQDPRSDRSIKESLLRNYTKAVEMLHQWKGILLEASSCNNDNTNSSSCLLHLLEEYDRKRRSDARIVETLVVPSNHERSRQYQEDERTEGFMIRHHPALYPDLIAKYQLDTTKVKARALADIQIIGLPKAGTSHLYRLLSHHLDAEPFHPTQKEYCMQSSTDKIWNERDDEILFRVNERQNEKMAPNLSLLIQEQEKAQKQLYEWYHAEEQAENSTIPLSVSAERKTTVNACIDPHEWWLHIHYVGWNRQRHPSIKVPKFLVLLRDPADWLWVSVLPVCDGRSVSSNVHF
jgi:hypothetical protein